MNEDSALFENDVRRILVKPMIVTNDERRKLAAINRSELLGDIATFFVCALCIAALSYAIGGPQLLHMIFFNK
jgi:hypothetical protein